MFRVLGGSGFKGSKGRSLGWINFSAEKFMKRGVAAQRAVWVNFIGVRKKRLYR
jgi:hypothetical protein